MDPRNRADDALDRARARGAFVVTPDSATSPMDASSTVRIPRELIDEADRDPDSTVVLPHSSQQEPPSWPEPSHDEFSHVGWPPDDHGRPQYDQVQYGQPQYDWAQYGQAQYDQTQYDQTQYDQSQTGRLHYGRLQHGQAQYDWPQYGQPQYDRSQTEQLHYGQLQHSRLEHGRSPGAQAPAGDENMPPNPYDAQRGPGEFGPPGSWTAQQYPNSPG